jgi:hypothetical protein
MVYSKNFGVNYGKLQRYWSKLMLTPKISQKLQCTARYSNNFAVSTRALYGGPEPTCWPLFFEKKEALKPSTKQDKN